MRPRGRLRGAHVQRIESLRKVTTDPQSSAAHAGAYATLHKIAIALLECHDLVAAMAASDSAQDQHNALIHHKSFLETETAFVTLLKAPHDANLWLQLGLHAFNSRREHYSASLAIEQAMKLAPRMTRYAYYLLYHAWGQVRWDIMFGDAILSRAPHEIMAVINRMDLIMAVINRIDLLLAHA